MNDKNIAHEHAKAALDLIKKYCNSNELQEAQNIFDTMPKAINHKKITILRAKASSKLISSYVKIDKLQEAQNIFNAMPKAGDNKEITILLAKALLELKLNDSGDGDENTAKVREIYHAMAKLSALDNNKKIAILHTKLTISFLDAIHLIFYRKREYVLELLSFIYPLCNHKEVIALYIKASIRLIRNNSVKRFFPQAQDVFDTLPNIKGRNDIGIKLVIELAEVSQYLVAIQCDRGNIQDALRILKVMAAFVEHKKIVIQRSKAIRSLINHYGGYREFKKAQALYKTLTDLGDFKEIEIERAKSAYSLVYYYLRTESDKNFKKAQAIFESMPDSGKYEDVVEQRAKASASLVIAYGKAKNFKKAQSIFEAMADYKNYKKVIYYRAKSFATLIACYGDAGDLPQAQKLFEAMVDFFALEDNESIIVFRAKASVYLIFDYIKIAKDLKKAQAIFDAMADYEKNEKIVHLRSNASYSLIEAYVNAEDLQQAHNLLHTMVNIGDFKIIAYVRIMAAHILIKYYCAAGDLGEAQKLFEAMPKVKDLKYMEKNHQEYGGTLEQSARREAAKTNVPIEYARVAVTLISAYLKTNTGDNVQQMQENLQKAHEIFDKFDSLGSIGDIKMEYAKSAVTLMSGYAKIKTVNNGLQVQKKAQDIINAMPKAGDNVKIAELYKEAQKYLDEIER